MPPTKAPLLVCTALGGDGHSFPVLSIAAYMRRQGHDVLFITHEKFKPYVEEAGIEYVQTLETLSPQVMANLVEVMKQPANIATFALQVKVIISDTLPQRFRAFHQSLEEIKARDPGRQIIILEDAFNMLSFPYWHGAPLPKGFNERPKSVGLGCAPLCLESQDIAPLVLGLPPDSTESGRARNKTIIKLVRQGPQKPLIDSCVEGLRQCGVPSPPDFGVWNTGYESYDLCYQLCSPSLEYPLSDLPVNMSFAGVLPRTAVGPDYKYPEWWPEIKGSKENGTRVIFVSQGTVNTDHSQLVAPTMAAFADDPGIIVVVTLGGRGVELAPEINPPSNARVIDYIPYDVILEYADVFVTNCGYGAFCHAIKNGCPLVGCGETEEKLEVALRAVYAGVGINLQTQQPAPELIKGGVEKVFLNDEYRQRAMELKKENEDIDVLETVRKGIESLAK